MQYNAGLQVTVVAIGAHGRIEHELSDSWALYDRLFEAIPDDSLVNTCLVGRSWVVVDRDRAWQYCQEGGMKGPFKNGGWMVQITRDDVSPGCLRAAGPTTSEALD